MPEYIEREALRAEALRLTGASEFAFDHCFPYWQFSKCIEEAPAADVETVRHGKWVFTNAGWKCNLCSHSMPYWPMASTQEETPYCPNCGCKMVLDGKDDNE